MKYSFQCVAYCERHGIPFGSPEMDAIQRERVANINSKWPSAFKAALTQMHRSKKDRRITLWESFTQDSFSLHRINGKTEWCYRYAGIITREQLVEMTKSKNSFLSRFAQMILG